MKTVKSLVLSILWLISGGVMATNVSTHLMFQGDADEALKLYQSVFPEFDIQSQELHESGDNEGKIQKASVKFAGHELIVFDSPPVHNFTFTPAMSLFVEFEDADALKSAFETLSEDGEVAMPLGDYGFSPLFGWFQDRFGVSWQLNLKTDASLPDSRH